MFKFLIKLIIISILTGCDGDSVRVTSLGESSLSLNKHSKEYFGTLSDATIKIYELGLGEKKLLFSENTTGGNDVNEIGNFDAHTQSFDSKIFYLYELSGGDNWDIDCDGIIDLESTKNKFIYRSIYKGKKIHVAWWGAKIRE